MWFAIYDLDTGKLVSVGTRVADDVTLAKFGRAKVEVPDNPMGNPALAWSEAQRAFVSVTPPRPKFDRQAFVRRFTEAELEALFTAAAEASNAKVRAKVRAFIETLRLLDFVDMNDDWVGSALNRLEQAGIIGAGRAAQIRGD